MLGAGTSGAKQRRGLISVVPAGQDSSGPICVPRPPPPRPPRPPGLEGGWCPRRAAATKKVAHKPTTPDRRRGMKAPKTYPLNLPCAASAGNPASDAVRPRVGLSFTVSTSRDRRYAETDRSCAEVLHSEMLRAVHHFGTKF